MKPGSNICGCWLANNEKSIGTPMLPFRRIFHPTDFSAADSAAFAHAVKLTERPGWSWDMLVAKGDPVEWILAAGADFDVDLIVMTTEGHTSLFDLLSRKHHRTGGPWCALPLARYSCLT
jgi:hypothetical protein